MIEPEMASFDFKRWESELVNIWREIATSQQESAEEEEDRRDCETMCPS